MNDLKNMSASEWQEFFLLLMLIGALTGALGPVGPIAAMAIHFVLRVYYLGWPK